METRLIVAYSLIAIMATLVIFGGIMLFKKREKARLRNAGKGEY
jgi:hypothetical protein